MQDGSPWPGNNVRDHPGMIQVRGCSFNAYHMFRANIIVYLTGPSLCFAYS